MQFQLNSRLLARQALIAALYTVLTLSGFGISYGPVQFRYSEILMWLTFLDPKNIIGLSLGCFIANITSPYGLLDMVVGTSGTLFAGIGMAKSPNKWLAAIWPAVFSFIYAGEAMFVGEIPPSLFPIVTGQIMLSELIVVGVIGIPIFMILSKNTKFMDLAIDRQMKPLKDDWVKQFKGF